ncbi:hypothetical protein K431DRAFT_289172 [Polychaeton citri CBS 116435]|uniref:Protein-S-isoprenylcysteine O-methyltransferase n=1 Tax=Polychaeton citri CBS 116435 TaxID=1314669 RepID=A0A9P4PZJ0_9PEZI|nr:hypothetical protein K431DRAFT_289172 [Polychaeton citri CBS 116435]
MPVSISLAQTSLAVIILGSSVGTYIALSPPNPSSSSTVPSTGDSIRWLNLANKHTTKIALAPLGLLALHTSCLTYFHPSIPPFILRHGAENNLNTKLITWSAATSIPLALVFCCGIPLRLISHTSLGKNFTFTLAEPDRLTTTGVYRYVQHPSYTGLVVLIVCNVALLGRMDGVLSCWFRSSWYQILTTTEWIAAPIGLSMLLFGIWTRVREEEGMLHDKFAFNWEKWHVSTARLIPWMS